MRLVTLGAPARPVNILEIPPQELDDISAGIQFMILAAELFPGQSLEQIAFEPLGKKWWEKVLAAPGNLIKDSYDLTKTVLGDLKDGVGDVIKDTFSLVGDKVGDAARLVTDPQVLNGALQIGSAYATGGASALLSQVGGGSAGAGIMDFISNLGKSWKNESSGSGSLNLIWIVGGVGVGGLILYLLMRKK